MLGASSNQWIKTVACEINELIDIRLILLSDFFFNPWILLKTNDMDCQASWDSYSS